MEPRQKFLPERRDLFNAMGGVLAGLFLAGSAGKRRAYENARNVLTRVELEALENARPRRHPAVSGKVENGRFTLYRKGSGIADQLLFFMNSTGKTIWENCDGINSGRDISLMLRREYQVPFSQARSDCLYFLSLLKSRRVIRL